MGLPRFGRALRVLATFACLSGVGAAAAPSTDQPALSSWLVKPKSDQQLATLAERFELVHKRGDVWEINVLASQRDVLLTLAPDAELLDPDLAASLKAQLASDPSFAGYRSLADVEALLSRLATQRPDIAKLERYGTSEQGRPLYALKLSDNAATDEDEPELMLTSATHGDEIITVEVLLTLLEEIVAGYGTDARLTAMIDNHELYFIPVVNADGFAARARYAGGVDPNRDYPWPETPNRTPTACIRDVMAFFHGRTFAGSIDFHASGQLVMYPWAYTTAPIDPADAQTMDDLGQLMAASNGYTVGPISRVIYVAKGSSADYYYWKGRSLSYGIELTTSKAPPTSQIPRVVTEAREMTWKFIENF